MAARTAGQAASAISDADDPSARRLLTVLLRRYGIPVAETVTADCAESAVEAAWWLGFPVTLVAEGTRLTCHAGITRCGLATPAQVRAAYWQLAASLGAAMTGVRMRRPPQQGAEVIVRLARDASGEGKVTLTLGGPAATLVGTRVTRSVPITTRTAWDMLDELHGSPADETDDGTDNTDETETERVDSLAPTAAVLDLAALAELLERVSRLAVAVPHVTELELNPVIVTRGGAAVAGVRGRFHRARSTRTGRAKLRRVS